MRAALMPTLIHTQIETRSGREWQRGFSAAAEYFAELHALETIFKPARTRVGK